MSSNKRFLHHMAFALVSFIVANLVNLWQPFGDNGYTSGLVWAILFIGGVQAGEYDEKMKHKE